MTDLKLARGRPPTGNAKNPVTYLLPPDIVQAVAIAAQKRRTSRTAIVEEALREYLQKHS